jgi:hypothetical protein
LFSDAKTGNIYDLNDGAEMTIKAYWAGDWALRRPLSLSWMLLSPRLFSCWS